MDQSSRPRAARMRWPSMHCSSLCLRLPEIVGGRRPGDLVRIWSFPCATGEEPYSIALWLLENWQLVDAYNVEIVGSDIDTEALAAAALGIYGERALSRLPGGVVAGYFEPPADGLRRRHDATGARLRGPSDQRP